MKITRIEPKIIVISNKTNWAFIEVQTSDGFVGIGEATLYGQEDKIVQLTKDFEQALLGKSEAAIGTLVAETSEVDNRVVRAVISAIEQASWDIKGQREGLPVYELLGGAVNERIPIYANINRRTTDRTPEGFARSARDAVVAGYNLIKVAPFDDLKPEMGVDGDTLFDAGMERIYATCDAAGENVQVLVDCHWRLSVSQAKDLITEAAKLGLYWVECPLPEDPNNFDNLIELRSLKEALGVRLAGAEEGTNLSYFEKFVSAKIYDVIMPDVKYAGGIAEMMQISKLASDNGIGFSPHNPSGPLCHIASLHIAAAIPNLMVLEHQYDESPLFAELCPNAVPKIGNGLSLLPSSPGLGFNLHGYA